MRKPTVRQLRAWQRRASTLARNAQALMVDAMEAVGVEYEMAGENLTSQADEITCTAENFVSYLETCIEITKSDAGRAALAQQGD